MRRHGGSDSPTIGLVRALGCSNADDVLTLLVARDSVTHNPGGEIANWLCLLVSRSSPAQRLRPCQNESVSWVRASMDSPFHARLWTSSLILTALCRKA